ncbi:hypothetical protein [Labrys neptuniae]
MFIGREDSVIAHSAIAIAWSGALRAAAELHDQHAEHSRLVAQILLDPSAWEDEDTGRHERSDHAQMVNSFEKP